MPLTENQALISLRVDPANFLARYALYIAGDLNNGVVNCAIMDMASPVRRPGSILRTANMHTTQTFMIGPVAVVGNAGPNFQAHWLKMSEWQTARDIYNIQVQTLDGTGPELMFTVMLSGCAIAIRDNGGGSIDIAHVRPNADMPGTNEDAMLDGAETHRILGLAGWTTVYGRGNYAHNRKIAIVGVRQAGVWHVYAQKQEMSLMGAGNIRKVKRII
jgi:hypothetical protein